MDTALRSLNASIDSSLLRPIERPLRSELSHIQWLLTLQSLPTADVTEASIEHFLVYRDAVGIAGVVGLDFELLGFRCLERDRAPSAIEHSPQFKSLCPSTAVLMVKP
jgi:hypothetical protein